MRNLDRSIVTPYNTLMNRLACAALMSGLVFASALVTEAAVKVVTLVFGPTSPDYVVPAGKVLLIEHISAFFGNSSGGAFDKVVIGIAAVADNNPAIVTTPWSFSTSNPAQSIHLDRPLRAAAGSSVNIFLPASNEAQDVRIQGLLVDASDLYAANLGIETKAVALADQTLEATVRLSSARPAILRSEVSFSLQTWALNPTQQVFKELDSLEYTVSTQVEQDATRKFLRASARTPEIP